MNKRWQTIKELDEQLRDWQTANQKFGRPPTGWVKTLRTALRMTTEQLASRVGLKRSRIVQLENAEVNDAVTLRTLREAANAIDCDLVYAIVPKANSSLETIIKHQAEQLAHQRVARETEDIETLQQQKAQLSTRLIENFNKKLWANERNQVFNKKLKELLFRLQKEIQDNSLLKTAIAGIHIDKANIPEYIKALKEAIDRFQHQTEKDNSYITDPEFIKELTKALNRFQKNELLKKKKHLTVL